MRRLRWWLFLLRYRIARWRGKVWATGMVRPELLFASRESTCRVDQIHLVRLPGGVWFCTVHSWRSVTYADGCPFCAEESVTYGGARIESTDAPAAPTDYGYFNADKPTCRIWEDPHA